MTALAVYAGCIQAGAIFLPLNTAYTVSKIDYFRADSGARLIFCDPGFAPGLCDDAERLSVGVLTRSADGRCGDFADVVASTDPDWAIARRRPDGLAALLYTSGTTGRSKGALLSHENLRSNARVLADFWQFTSDDVLRAELAAFKAPRKLVLVEALPRNTMGKVQKNSMREAFSGVFEQS